MTNINSVTVAVTQVATAYSGALTPRYEYISVMNESGAEIWVRTDGVAATVDGDFCACIAAGEVAVLGNMAPLWDQSQTVLQLGNNNQWGQSKIGQVTNPGTSVSVIAVSTGTLATTPSVTIQGAG